MITLTKNEFKNIWINSQGLNKENPFGLGTKAVAKAVKQLGYIQIDTINVIQRCHHHILYNRIPNYHPKYLHQAQSEKKTVFEYWTHALAYIPTSDFQYFVHIMNSSNLNKSTWFKSVTEKDYQKVKNLISKNGPISINEIKDDVLVKKNHAWGTKKPSKKALQLGFFKGDFVISERIGMLKKYELTERHFDWQTKPKPLSDINYAAYILNRALTSQGIINLDSACYLETKIKPILNSLIQNKLKSQELVEVKVKNLEKLTFYSTESALKQKNNLSERTHILSPFDPLIIQRKKLKMIFDYEHIFEAYIPKEKRKYGYFTLPVLNENNVIALLDIKTDRELKKINILNWIWLSNHKTKKNKSIIESELHTFEKFQIL